MPGYLHECRSPGQSRGGGGYREVDRHSLDYYGLC